MGNRLGVIVVFIWGIAGRYLKRRCKDESSELRYNCVRCGWHCESDSVFPVDLIFVFCYDTAQLTAILMSFSLPTS